MLQALMTNFRQILLITILTVAGFLAWKKTTETRKNQYLKKRWLSDKGREELLAECKKDHYQLMAYMAFWLLCAIFALCGNVLGIIFSVILTAYGLYYVYGGAKDAKGDTLRVVALADLALPLAGLIAIVGTKYLGIVLGLIAGIAVLIGVPIVGKSTKAIKNFFRNVKNLFKEEEK